MDFFNNILIFDKFDFLEQNGNAKSRYWRKVY
jgi:hypothetical protein